MQEAENRRNVTYTDYFNMYYWPDATQDKKTAALNAEASLHKNWIIPALKFLQDQGIGAKRTWGLGKFEFEEKEIEIKTPEKSEKFVNLSVVFPKENDLSLIKNTFIKNTSWFRWHLITRGGYPVYSPFAESFSLRKPLIKMIGEGSVLPEIKGNILKIPENEEILRKINFPHFVYHYGRGFLIPAKLKENYE